MVVIMMILFVIILQHSNQSAMMAAPHPASTAPSRHAVEHLIRPRQVGVDASKLHSTAVKWQDGKA